jgi:predicted AlkP superfamily phosphohydrolase/phosphomutase
MDGLDPVLLSELMAKGQLPHFVKLKERGFCGPLSTSNPPQSPVAWTDIAVGANPGKHGLFDFIDRNPKNYLPDLAIVKLNRKNLLGSRESMFLPVRKGTSFWEITAQAGLPSTVLRWPITFPPGESGAQVLSGLGVPDIMGGLGRYTFYTNIPPAPDEEGKEKVIRLDRNRGEVETYINGPMTQGLTSRKPSTLALKLTMNPGSRSMALTVNGQTFTLKEGEWTPWLSLSFDVGPLKKIKGMGKFHLVEMNSRVALYLTPIQIDPHEPCYPISSPDAFATELESAIGRYYTLGMPEDTKALIEHRISEEVFLDTCNDIVVQQEKMLDYELNRFKEGLLACVFFTTDRIQHIFWVTRDPEHPLYDREYAKKYGDIIPSYYRRMDTVLGKVLPALDERTALLVCSDHGFSSYRRSFHLNSWLVEQGLMVLKERVNPQDKEGGPLFRYVDWPRTKVYSLGFGSLYFNMKGREGKGTITEQEAQPLSPKIADALTKVRDAKGGRAVVARVYTRSEAYHGPYVESAPDLIVGYHPGYRASWQTAIGGTPQGLFEDNLKKWSGDHCIDPIAVPGIFLSNFAVNTRNPRNVDVAPTLLSCFGLKPDQTMEGISLI